MATAPPPDGRPGRIIRAEVEALGIKRYQDAELSQQVKIMRQVCRSKSPCLLPQSRIVERWDLVMIVLLIFVSIVTPFEVGFIDAGVPLLFVLNCFIDIFFVIDMVMQFFLAFHEEIEAAGRLVTDLRRIRIRYLKGWFIMDFISILPFDAISQMMILLGKSSGPFSSQMRAVRLLRVARLLKLARLFRCSRIYTRVSAKVEILFMRIEVVKWCISLIFMSHLFACMLALVGDLSVSEHGTSWYCSALEGKGRDCEDNVWDEYNIAIYWSVMTITSIGYGDILPTTNVEMGAVTIMMLLGSFLWAHIVGSFCAVVSAMDTEKMQYQQRMDAVLMMSHDRFLPRDLRVRLRQFFQQSRRMHRMATQGQIMTYLSPALQGEVALTVTLKFLEKVYWLSNAEGAFLQTLAKSLELHFFSPREKILPAGSGSLESFDDAGDVRARSAGHAKYGRSHKAASGEDVAPEVCKASRNLSKDNSPPLTIMERGIAARGVVLSAGSVWHEDSILVRNPALRDPTRASSLTFCSVYTITRELFLRVLEGGTYPNAERQLRRAMFTMVFTRTVVRAAQEAKKQAARKPSLRVATTEYIQGLPLEPEPENHAQKLVDVIHELLGVSTSEGSNGENSHVFTDFQRSWSNRMRTQTRLDLSKLDVPESDVSPTASRRTPFRGDAGELSSRMATMEKSLSQLLEDKERTSSELATIRQLLTHVIGSTPSVGPTHGPGPRRGASPSAECWAPDRWSVYETSGQDCIERSQLLLK